MKQHRRRLAIVCLLVLGGWGVYFWMIQQCVDPRLVGNWKPESVVSGFFYELNPDGTFRMVTTHYSPFDPKTSWGVRKDRLMLVTTSPLMDDSGSWLSRLGSAFSEAWRRIGNREPVIQRYVQYYRLEVQGAQVIRLVELPEMTVYPLVSGSRDSPAEPRQPEILVRLRGE